MTIDEEEYWIEEDWLRKEFGKYGTCHYEEIVELKGEEKKLEIDEGIKNGLYVLVKKNNGMHIVGRYRLIKEDGSKFYSVQKHLNKKGVHDLEELQLSSYFDYPKPSSLIFDLVKGATFSSVQSGDIILDFFAGSATTAHAVMKLNAEDGGNRQYIMVQIPEKCDEKSEAFKAGYKTIAEIGKERIRRAGEKIKAEMTENDSQQLSLLEDKAVKANLDIGFKVFKLDETNFTQWDEETTDPAAALLRSVQSIKPNRTSEDALYEILLKYGIDLTLPVTEIEIDSKKVFSLAANYLLVCLEKNLSLSTIEEIAKLKPQRVVFYDDAFKDDVVKLNAEQTLRKFGVEDLRVI